MVWSAIPTIVDNFYPRSPCGERPRQTSRLLQGSAISIHALLAESDLSACWRGCWSRCISIHALLAESDVEDGDDLGRVRIISIHALLAESDRQRELHRQDILISIHALLAESDVRM